MIDSGSEYAKCVKSDTFFIYVVSYISLKSLTDWSGLRKAWYFHSYIIMDTKFVQWITI